MDLLECRAELGRVALSYENYALFTRSCLPNDHLSIRMPNLRGIHEHHVASFIRLEVVEGRGRSGRTCEVLDMQMSCVGREWTRPANADRDQVGTRENSPHVGDRRVVRV